MILSYDWQPFDGDYQKKMQDIKLANGDIVTTCWPNAGYWNCCEQKGNEKYYNRKIPVMQATHVRLNFDFYN